MKKQAVKTTVNIDAELMAKVREYCAIHGHTISWLMSDCLRQRTEEKKKR